MRAPVVNKNMSFQELGLSPALMRALDELKFTEATPIQREAIPPALEGRDVIACASTGSGKTAAFLLPILQRLEGKRRGAIRALVITPTRELAAQIEEHRALLARHLHSSGAAVYGGVAMSPQARAFRSGVDVLCATPGRLLDHLQYPYARLNQIEILVLDEADRMLDMGFLPDIRRILGYLPKERQTLLFSATLPQPIVTLARDMQTNPVTLNTGRQSRPPESISHGAFGVRQQLKSPLLLHLLSTGKMESVVVFTRTRHRADRLANYLDRHGVSCARIHGNRSQAQRTQALAGFKGGEYRVLVATDVAARGIDVEALSHVVNFDVPNVPDDYIHRVGRTGRASATGEALTFFAAEELADMRAIERALGASIPRLTAEGFDPEAAESERPETPVRERIAAIRAEKAALREKQMQRAAAGSARERHSGSPSGNSFGRGGGASGRGGSTADSRFGRALAGSRSGGSR